MNDKKHESDISQGEVLAKFLFHTESHARTCYYHRWNLEISRYLLLSSLPLEIDSTRNLDQFLYSFFILSSFFALMHIRVLRYNQKNQIFTFIRPFRTDFMANTKQLTEVEVVLVYTSWELGLKCLAKTLFTTLARILCIFGSSSFEAPLLEGLPSRKAEYRLNRENGLWIQTSHSHFCPTA